MSFLESSPPINGILLVNKPEGITSNRALQTAKRLFGAKKAGHTGSLDPLATGMLPICFGEATKVCQFFLDAEKCYETTALLGIKTNTSDATGEVIERIDDFVVTEAQLIECLLDYQGDSKQTPSMFSALKHQGVPLYRLARQGIEVARKARDIHVRELVLNQFDGRRASLTVTCSKGTYIRNLVEDIGDSLGVGAHVTCLHRLHTLGFEHMPMFSLDVLEKMTQEERMACLIPMDKAINYMPSLTLNDEEVLIVRQGRVIMPKPLIDNPNCIRLYNEDNQFIGLGEQQVDGSIKARRLISFVSSSG